MLGPVAPASATPPTIPQFDVSLSSLNRVTLSWRTSGGYSPGNPYRLVYIDGPRLYPPEWGFNVTDDVGFASQSLNGEVVTMTFSAPPGIHTYTLSVKSNEGELRQRTTIPIDVPRVQSPTITATSSIAGDPAPFVVNPFAPKTVTLAWSAGAGSGTFELTKPDGTVYADTGTHTYAISPTEQAVLGDRLQEYSLVHCKTNAVAEKVCSDPAKVSIDRRGAVFDTGRTSVPPGSNPIVSWRAAGNSYLVTTPAAMTFQTVPATTAETTMDKWVTASQVQLVDPSPGPHRLVVYSCNFAAVTSCALHKVQAPTAGTFTAAVPVGTVVEAGEKLGTVTAGGKSTDVSAVSPGRVDAFVVNDGTAVAKLAPVVQMVTASSMHVIGGSPANTWTNRDWSTDFKPVAAGSSRLFPTDRYVGTGAPLDVTFAGTDLWSTSEFHRSVMQLSDALSDLNQRPHEPPLLQTATSTLHGQMMKDAQPFQNPFGSGTSSLTALAERVIPGAANEVWFTEGGAGGAATDADHSRIVRFNTAAQDLDTTPYDDRFCVVAVPGGRNEAYGLAYAGGRIWFAENRSATAQTVGSRLSSFNPTGMPCQNQLDYANPDAVAAIKYCDEITPVAPEQFASGCITRLTVPNALGLAHLSVDPATTNTHVVLWMTEVYGKAIGRFHYDVAADGAKSNGFDRYPINTSSKRVLGDTTIGGFLAYYGAAPWRIEANADYVYFSEFGDGDLVRFKKSRVNDPNCKPPPEPSPAIDPFPPAVINPCMEEMHVPLLSPDEVINSIQIQGTTLTFAMSGGRIGTVDIASAAAWGNGGVLYTGMDALADPARRQIAPGNYNGIAVNAAGDVAVSDFLRKQVILLRKK